MKENSKGVKFYDRELGGKVRTLTLEQIQSVLQGELYAEDKAYHKALLLKLAGNILPRLNEHTGADGKDLIPQPLSNEFICNNNSNKEDSEA